MPTEQTSGTQTAVISTEHTLATVTTAGNYVLYVDTSNMVNGDELELRTKIKVLTGSTSRQHELATYLHVQSSPDKGMIPVGIVHEVVYTLKQVAGTGRNFDWSVVAL